MKIGQGILLVFVVGLLLLGGVFAGYKFSTTSSADAVEQVTGGSTATLGCPDTGLTALKIDLFNSANATGSEGVDETVYVFKADGTYVTSFTDTTSPTAQNVPCGEDFVAKAISTSGASGDSSYIDEVIGEGKIVDGQIEFSTVGAQLNLRANVEQHASLKCRAYDNIQRALMYDSADASATDYETDGVTWMATTSNTTKVDETLGMDIEFECLAVETDTDYNDRGILVLLEMPTTKWEETPAVYVNNQPIAEVTLTGAEKSAYVDYEYAFLIPSDVVMKDGGQGFDVRVVNNLKSGITSVTADPEVDFAPRGAHLATDAQSVISGVAVTDASTPVQIHTLFDMTVDMT